MQHPFPQQPRVLHAHRQRIRPPVQPCTVRTRVTVAPLIPTRKTARKPASIAPVESTRVQQDSACAKVVQRVKSLLPAVLVPSALQEGPLPLRMQPASIVVQAQCRLLVWPVEIVRWVNGLVQKWVEILLLLDAPTAKLGHRWVLESVFESAIAGIAM